MRRLLAGGSALCSVFASGALAAEPQPPIQLDVTDSTSVLYAWDNRDESPNQVATVVNDDWGAWLNRLNVQGNEGDFRFGLRLDSAWFYTSPDPTRAGLSLVEGRKAAPDGISDAEYFRGKVYESGHELSNRYINWTYPAKLYAGYATRDIDVMVGDFYAELGRGLVLSVRKRDELSSDDSIRGVRVSGSRHVGPLRVEITALGGSPNPLRIDEGSGRYLGVHSSALPGFLVVTEAGMPRAVATDFAPDTGRCETFLSCTYAPDRLLGGQLKLGVSPVTLGSQGSFLWRKPALSPDPVRSADRVATLSQSIEGATDDGKVAIYFEGAWQKLEQTDEDARLPAGHALYLSTSLAFEPFFVLLEAKHYRRFFPLRANVDVGRAREFSLLEWSAPPTTEDPFVDTEFDNFNTCVTGGRARGDAALARRATAFGWVGYYETFAETVSNDRCDTSRDNRNRVLDLASGFELKGTDGRTRGTVTAGTRFDRADAPLAARDGTTHVFYRELYVRYDVVQALDETFALELQGFHRRRRRALGSPTGRWFEGEHLTGLQVGSRLSFGVGIEYNTDPLPPDFYVNGSVKVRPTPDSSVALFVGQRRSSLRCVGGVCQVRPGFEGMRLDASLTF